MSVDEPAATDGRSARAERTRTAIVDALISLLEEGDLQPTANRIADRAGISLRLIYHHFGDLESLYEAVAVRNNQRLKARSKRVAVDQPLGRRIDQVVAQRADTLEWLTPIMRAAQLNIVGSPELRSRRSTLYARSEREVATVFALELDPLPPDERATAASAINGALFWGHWDDLRKSGRSTDEAAAALRFAVRAIFVAIGADPDG